MPEIANWLNSWLGNSSGFKTFSTIDSLWRLISCGDIVWDMRFADHLQPHQWGCLYPASGKTVTTDAVIFRIFEASDLEADGGWHATHPQTIQTPTQIPPNTNRNTTFVHVDQTRTTPSSSNAPNTNSTFSHRACSTFPPSSLSSITSRKRIARVTCVSFRSGPFGVWFPSAHQWTEWDSVGEGNKWHYQEGDWARVCFQD